ncbi:tetratricopeptide repeat protein [Rhizobium rhizosphaerae]|uniref:tetratricopeptide repeat protein n=1 Tax=Xaviernesmea rhizosphaerae TaxID=1672749 RepID=UPI00111A2E72|nr:tetratricopeptide repeat protein [Xaviernesmea rhizosphaerae]
MTTGLSQALSPLLPSGAAPRQSAASASPAGAGARPWPGLSALVAVALLATACGTPKKELTTGSISSSAASPRAVQTMTEPELRAAASSVGAAYEKNPGDKTNGLNYANLLRMTGKNEQSLAVMQQLAIRFPTDREVLAAYGKAQAAAGQLEQALATIGRAQTPDRPDWRLKSAEGAILDQLGRSAEARQAYRNALDIKPNDPSVLSNLGMSYLLTKDLKTAETYLRSAAAQPGADSGVRQNLALAVGLQGRFDEAERIASAELSPAQAQDNVRYLRAMLAQQNSWKQLASQDTRSPTAQKVN